MKADFHIHSNVSDGSDTISQIIESAKKKGLDMIAITDHDTLEHVAQIPKHPDIQIIAGIEISAIHRESNTKAHILGYNIKKSSVIDDLTFPLLKARNENSERQVYILRNNGYKIDVDQLTRGNGRYLYKQHIMEYLVNTGQAEEMFGAFYQNTFKNKGICAFDIEYIDVFDAVQAIKSAGGLAVLAHPGQQQNLWLVPQLVSVGLGGLEMNHQGNSKEDITEIKEMAKEYQLFLTGGSDYHGKYEAQVVNIGDFISEKSGIEAICQSQSLRFP